MLSFKYFSDFPVDVQNQIHQHLLNNDNIGYELAMYAKKEISPESELVLASISESRKSIHAFHAEISLLSLLSKDERLKANANKCLAHELSVAKRLGVRKYIIHNSCNVGSQSDYEHKYNKYSMSDAINGADIVLNTGLVPYLEKTFEDIDWFYRMYEKLPSEVGFCLDIGHVRVWHRTQLENWATFMEYITKKGHPINFHIHNNDGTGDHHVNLRTSFEMGYLDKSRDYAPNGVITFLQHMHKKYGKESLFTMESHDAHLAYDFVNLSLCAD